MPQYKAPLRDIRFVLYDLLEIDKHYATLPGAEDLSPEVLDAMLGEAAKLIGGEWSGTMCLTESHCGTDLGLLRTKAVPNAEGSFDITGEKIFISAGDHDMADNIVHLVLARLPDAPPGTKGISLFIVPKA